MAEIEAIRAHANAQGLTLDELFVTAMSDYARLHRPHRKAGGIRTIVEADAGVADRREQLIAAFDAWWSSRPERSGGPAAEQAPNAASPRPAQQFRARNAARQLSRPLRADGRHRRLVGRNPL